MRTRSYELEHLDKGDYTPPEYEGCLLELRRINRLLGDTHALKCSLLPELRRSGDNSFSLLDVGAGSGELLRAAAGWAQAEARKFRLVGLELNRRSALAISEESRAYPDIHAVQGDALHLPFGNRSFDYVICSLFLHHFSDEQAINVLSELGRVSGRAVFVIDLRRSILSYLLFRTVGRLLFRNRLIREDGALSILRSFLSSELCELAERSSLSKISVKRRFPFRLVLSASNETGMD